MQEYKARGYQRRYLRAPYKEDILFADSGHIFKAKTLNISEGGVLLDNIGHFPEHNHHIAFMVCLPQFPMFKNYTLERLRNHNPEVLEAKVIRFYAKIARKLSLGKKIDGIFASKIGLQIQEISDFDQAKISHYVDVFSSNLIYLQVLIDTINDDKNNLEKIRLISHYLGYDKDVKIALLRKQVEHDYKSLQWL